METVASSSYNLVTFYKIYEYSWQCNPFKKVLLSLEHRALKNVNNNLNANIYSYLQTSGGQISNLYLNIVNFFNASVT